MQILVRPSWVIWQTFHWAHSHLRRKRWLSAFATGLVRISLLLFFLAETHGTRTAYRRWNLLFTFSFSKSSLWEIWGEAQPGLVILRADSASSSTFHALIAICDFLSTVFVGQLSLYNLNIASVRGKVIVLVLVTHSMSWGNNLISVLRNHIWQVLHLRDIKRPHIMIWHAWAFSLLHVFSLIFSLSPFGFPISYQF